MSQRVRLHGGAAGLEPRSVPWSNDPTQAGPRRQRLAGGIEFTGQANRVHIGTRLVQVVGNIRRSGDHDRISVDDLLEQAVRQTEPMPARLPGRDEPAVPLDLAKEGSRDRELCI